MVFIKKVVKKSFNMLGYELTAIKKQTRKKAASSPVLFNDMLGALHFVRGGTPASFRCPLEFCVHRMGLNFMSGGWHPFVETLKEYQEHKDLNYENSSLKRYYDTWQPVSAGEAFAGFEAVPGKLSTLSPHLIYLTPWSSRSVDRMDRIVRSWHKEDDSEHGGAHLTIDKHGFRDFGPVADVKGELEFKRLINVYCSIEEKGYDRSFGDIEVLVLKRGSDEYRYIHKGGGYHRAAAMVALGYKEIPATFFDPWIISLNDIDYWPQVRNGIWSRTDATGYFNHLFDFDSRKWAEKFNLVGIESIHI